MRPSASMAVIYFGVGFTLAGTLSMVLLTLLRPLLTDASAGLMAALLFAPLILGVALGARVATVGMRRRLKLGAALKQAFGFK